MKALRKFRLRQLPPVAIWAIALIVIVRALPQAVERLAKAATGSECAVIIMDLTLTAALVLLIGGAAHIALRDAARFSPMRLWALAVQTFRESVRRRVLLLIPGAMVLIVVIGHFQAGNDEVSEIHQATSSCIGISSAFTLLLMLLLSKSAFPRELESRTIYSLLTKPVTRLEVFAGKVLGLWLVAAVVLGLMGAFSYGYLRVRASQLTDKALARYEHDKQSYDNSERRIGSASQPGNARPRFGAWSADVDAAPPDEALKQHVDLGLLTAMNYLDSEPVVIHPLPPAGSADRPRDWIVTGRGYLALHVLDLAPVEERATDCYEVRLAADIPAAGESASAQATVRLFIPKLTEEVGKIATWAPPRAVDQAGWTAGVGEPLNFRLHRDASDRLWRGSVRLSGPFLRALGPVTQLALGIEVATNPPTQLVGLIPPGQAAPGQPGLEFIPIANGAEAGPSLPIRELRIIPRSNSILRFPLSGSPLDGPTEVAEYQFNDIPLDSLPAGEDLVFQLHMTVDKNSPHSVETLAIIVVPGPDNNRTTIFAAPSTRMSSFIHVPRTLVRDGRLTIQVRPQQAADQFTVSTGSLRLLTRPTPVALNIFKSMLVCLIEAMVVVALGVMGSVFLSWPVALLMNAALLIAGNLLDMVRGLLAAPGGPAIFQTTGEDKAIDLASQAANEFFKYCSHIVERIVPDFTRFDPQAFIGQGLSIPWSSLLKVELGTIQLGPLGIPCPVASGMLAWAAAYMAVAMAIGYLTLHFKEVAK